MATATDGSALIIHQVETMYAAYSGSFNHEDVAGVVRYVSAPYAMTIGGNTPVVFTTAESVRLLFDQSLSGMKARGWARSDFKIVHVWPLSERHALLLTDVVRYRADGSRLESGRYLYSARANEPAWQITSVTDVVPPFAGPGEYPRAT